MKQKYFLFVILFLFTKSIYAQLGYVGEIRIFSGTYPPQNWVDCNGQLLNVNVYPELYSVIGTNYGGGANVFAVPDLNNRMVVAAGRANGMGEYYIGQTGGSNTATLTPSTMPVHSHNSNVQISTTEATSTTAGSDKYLAAPVNILNGTSRQVNGYSTNDLNIDLNVASVTNTGLATPSSFSIQQPVLAVRYIICVNGELPRRPQ